MVSNALQKDSKANADGILAAQSLITWHSLKGNRSHLLYSEGRMGRRSNTASQHIAHIRM